MDGWEFIKNYRQLECDKKSSIIVMLTSSINPDDKAKSADFQEINDYKTKPLSFETLSEIFDRYF